MSKREEEDNFYCAKVEKQEVGEGVHEKYHDLAHELEG
jgi:hypothetical protein